MMELDRPPAAGGERYAEIDVTDWPVVGDESRGTKPKRWLRHPETGRRWLMKDATENVYRPHKAGVRRVWVGSACGRVTSCGTGAGPTG